MRLFRRVVELRRFSAAAHELERSGASVSKEIAALEDHLGARLLHRTTRSLSLTSAGAEYYERCVQILDAIDEAEQALVQQPGTARGVVRMNVPMSFGLMHVSPLLPELLARWPALRLDVSFTDRFVDLVEDGADLAIRIATTLPDAAHLVARKLARARHVVCATPAYLAARGTPKTPDALAGHECISYSLSRNAGWWTFEGPGGIHRVPLRGRLHVDNSLVIRDAVLQGAGIAVLPSFYVGEELRSGRIVEVLGEYTSPLALVHAVHPRAKSAAVRVRPIVEHLASCFATAKWATR